MYSTHTHGTQRHGASLTNAHTQVKTSGVMNLETKQQLYSLSWAILQLNSMKKTAAQSCVNNVVWSPNMSNTVKEITAKLLKSCYVHFSAISRQNNMQCYHCFKLQALGFRFQILKLGLWNTCCCWLWMCLSLNDTFLKREVIFL